MVHNDDAHLACEVLQMSVDIAAAFDKPLGAEGCQASNVQPVVCGDEQRRLLNELTTRRDSVRLCRRAVQ